PLESKDLNLMLIGTIGFGIMLQSVAIVVWGSFGIAVPTPIPNVPIDVGGIIVTTYQLFVLAVSGIVMLLLYLFLDRTKLGTAMQSAAMDRSAATAMGVNVATSNAIAFAIGSAIAAVAGALVGPLLYVNPTLGVYVGIKGFAAAILGGFGSIPGAIVGGLIFGLIEAFASGPLSAYSELLTFVVFALAMMVRQTGIFGERTVDRAGSASDSASRCSSLCCSCSQWSSTRTRCTSRSSSCCSPSWPSDSVWSWASAGR
ncbi:MAG TPA: branched-chain amino acid ABC transporter permease, partial [Vicinamibacterales bacterium]|nr:branched-chain amino acid ABC transporter permease [Vicinamibacterales bacterium]